MTITNIGDLASSLKLRRDTGRVKTQLDRLSTELATGVTSDPVRKLKGDFGPLAGIERGLSRMESYRSVVEEFRLSITAQQTAIQVVRDIGDVSDTLLTLPETTDRTLLVNAGSDALTRFASVLGTLNTQVGGRSVFSGVDTNRPAIADLETIMSAIEADISAAGATTATDVDVVVSAWFDAGGGFDTIGYLGGPQATSEIRLSDNEIALPAVTAEVEPIREHLAALAKAALLGRDVLSGNFEEQSNLARIAGENLIATDDRLVTLQASIGATEAQIQRASVEVTSQAQSLEISRTRLIEVDPYEVAIQLQNSETQLQTIYTLTARLSGLSLVNFI